MVFLSLFSLGGIFLYQYLSFYRNNLHITFCDVGAGDAVVINTPARKTVLLDAGPDASVISCLKNHKPFWDDKIDLVVLNSIDAKYMTGLYYVLDRYNVLSIGIDNSVYSNNNLKELRKIIVEKKIKLYKLALGSRFTLENNLQLAIESSPALPDSSLVTRLAYKDFSLLLTGDARAYDLENVTRRSANKVQVLQIPAQGSLASLDKNIIDLLRPRLAVISVGVNNTSGYPKDQVLSILSQARIKVLRTDRDGDIDIESDGKNFWRK